MKSHTPTIFQLFTRDEKDYQSLSIENMFVHAQIRLIVHLLHELAHIFTYKLHMWLNGGALIMKVGSNGFEPNRSIHLTLNFEILFPRLALGIRSFTQCEDKRLKKWKASLHHIVSVGQNLTKKSSWVRSFTRHTNINTCTSQHTRTSF